MDSSDLDVPRRCFLCGEHAIDCKTLIVGKYGFICSECAVLCVLILGEAQQEEYSQRVADPPEMS